MADAFAPWTPPPAQNTAGQAVQTLSGLMGLQTQRQQLQLQQQELQRSQVQTQQDLGVNQFFSQWDPGAHHGDDGTLDIDSAHQSPAYEGLPGTARIAVDAKLNQLKGQQLQNKQSLATLNSDVVGQFGKLAQSLSSETDPTVRENALTAFAKQGPDQARIAGIYAPMLKQVPQEHMPAALRTMAAQAQDVSAQQAQTNVGEGTNAAGQNQIFDKRTGVRASPTLVGGATNPASPQVAGQAAAATAAGTLPYVAPTAAASASGGASGKLPYVAPTAAAGGMAENDTQRYSQIGQEGLNAQTGAQLADQVSRLADQVRTGKLTKEWADRLAVLKQNDPSITDRQMLTKYAAQLKTMATAGATTDQSRSQIDEGMPSPETMDPDAVKQAANYVGGIFRMRGARQQHADQYIKNTGSPLGIQQADNGFMQAADPTVFAYKALPAGTERQKFLVQHGLTTPEAQQAFKTRMNLIQHYVGQ